MARHSLWFAPEEEFAVSDLLECYLQISLELQTSVN